MAGQRLDDLKTVLDELALPDALRELARRFPEEVVFSTSFGMEDQVITDLIVSAQADILFFTLDTGRLFPETYDTWSRTVQKYGITIASFFPDERELQAFVSVNGPNPFYESVEMRKRCCGIRKVNPLKKALAGKAVWISGLRAGQSAGRSELPLLEWDESNGVIKYYPLRDWTLQDIRDYVREHGVPSNPLHDRGFLSIGCAPCTRAVRPGEDIRAGRWWWENNTGKECGLHIRN